VFRVFTILKPKILTRFLVSFFVICALVITGYEINQAYHASFATVNDRSVILSEYKPFKENTKAVSLEEPSTLKIEGDLPRLDGATALYPLYSAFVQATYPEKEYEIDESEVMSNKTGDAYTNLINGKVDIIFVAGPSRHQLADAERKGVDLKLTPIGYEAFVFFVNSKNKVTELSTHQIQDIYSGKITNWAELGGTNDKIRAFQRPENSGSQTMLQKVMAGKDLMTPPKEDVASGMGGIIEKTSSYRNYKNAIGYSFLFFATEMIENGKISLLKVDGINPEKSTIKSKEYPLAAEFYAVTTGSENPNVEPFIEWIQSQQGQYLVEKTGYISK
jgi:phosphate transport system substrate-binding protein